MFFFHMRVPTKGMPSKDTVPTKGIVFQDTVPTRGMFFQDSVPTNGKGLEPWVEDPHPCFSLVPQPLRDSMLNDSKVVR